MGHRDLRQRRRGGAGLGGVRRRQRSGAHAAPAVHRRLGEPRDPAEEPALRLRPGDPHGGRAYRRDRFRRRPRGGAARAGGDGGDPRHQRGILQGTAGGNRRPGEAAGHSGPGGRRLGAPAAPKPVAATRRRHGDLQRGEVPARAADQRTAARQQEPGAGGVAQRIAASGVRPADEGVEGGRDRRAGRARLLAQRTRRGGRTAPLARGPAGDRAPRRRGAVASAAR